MRKMKPIKEVDDKKEFYRGTRFRQYNIGLNVQDPKDDYYEYMLAQIPGESKYMLLTCVEGYKSGTPLALVKTKEDNTKFCVIGEAIKFSMGVEDIFLLDEDA